MTRVKHMSRGGWIVVGILIAMMLVPSGIAAVRALGYTGIEGTNGATSTLYKTDVTSAGQLMTADASPSTLFSDSAGVGVYVESFDVPLVVASGDDLVVNEVRVDTDDLQDGGATVAGVLVSGTSPACNGSVDAYDS